jgi:hypothetical protein
MAREVVLIFGLALPWDALIFRAEANARTGLHLLIAIYFAVLLCRRRAGVFLYIDIIGELRICRSMLIGMRISPRMAAAVR